MHPCRLAAELCLSPKVAARQSGLTVAQVRAIRDLRAARAARKSHVDPLLKAQRTRLWRRPSVLAADAARQAQEDALLKARRAREMAAASRAQDARAALIEAARIARRLGHPVRASKDRDGRVSSYYVDRPNGHAIRISDHLIPATDRRDAEAQARGESWGYAGWRGPEIIIERARTALWLRRAIVLALAGRSTRGTP